MHRRSLHRLTGLCLAFLAIPVAPTLAIEEGLQELRLPPLLVEQEYKPNTSMELPPPTYPLHKVEQLPFHGAWHEFVNVTTGGLVFRMPDIKLPGRMPIDFGRVYDSKISASLPPPPPGGPEEARWTEDLGPNWILGYTAYILPYGFNGLTMATTDGDIVRWANQGDGTYLPQDETASKHMLLESEGLLNLVETQTDGTRRTFTMGVANGSTHALTKIEDRSGNYIEMSYAFGRLDTITNSDGASLTLYRENNIPALFPIVRVTRVAVTDSSTTREVLFDYNTDGLLTEVTDITGKTWEFTYASNDKLTAAIDPTGDEFLSASYNVANRVATYEAQNGPWVFTYSTNRTFVDDAFSKRWEYRYLSTGITNKIIEPTGGMHQLTFDADRNPAGYTDPMGVAVSWDYNDDHLPVSYTPAGVGSNSIDYTYDPDEHWVDTVTSLDGGVTSFTRDADGRVLTETKPDGGEWTATYDSGNGDRLTLTLPLGNVQGGNGYEWTFTYDDFGQVETATDPTGRVFTFGYHETGELETFRRPDHMDGSTLVEAEWTYARDAAGRITEVTDPLGNTWDRVYDDAGRLIEHNGPEGTSLRYTYDERHRVTTVMVYNDGVTDPTTTYAYNAAGRLVSKTLPNGSTWTYGHDDSSRLTSVTDPLGRVRSYGRDLAGRVSSITHPGGQVVTMLRNSAGNLSKRTIPGGRVEDFLYDSTTGRLIQAKATLDSGAWIGTLDWEYDVMGRPESVQTSIADGSGSNYRQLQLAYDLNGNRTDLASIPAGESISYTYDQLDRLIETDSDLYDEWIVAYDAYSGNRIGVSNGSTSFSAWEYDQAGRLVFEQSLWPEKSGDYIYAYDDEGRIETVTDVLANTAFHTTWNSIGLPVQLEKLESSVVTETTEFTHDVSGNLIGRTKSGGGGDDEVFVFEWDALGRLIYARKDDKIRSYVWGDNPSDASALFNIWKISSDPQEESTEFKYGFDMHLSEVYSHRLGEEPVLVSQYRWSPISGGLALEATRHQGEGVYEVARLIAEVNGHYGEVSSTFEDTALATPVTAIDRATFAIDRIHDQRSPDIDAPFGRGAWKGMFDFTSANAISQFATGLVAGRRETSIIAADVRNPTVQFGTLASPTFAPSDLFDDWLVSGLAMPEVHSGIPQLQVYASQSAATHQGPYGIPELPGSDVPGERPDLPISPCSNGSCQNGPEAASGSTVPLCACPGAMNQEYDGGAGGGGAGGYCCPDNPGGGIPFDPVVCNYFFDRSVAREAARRNQELSPGGVSYTNGELVRSVTELKVYDTHGELDFTRTYRSGNNFFGSMGYSWNHNWNELIAIGFSTGHEECQDVVRWVSFDGNVTDFYFKEDGTIEVPEDSLYDVRKVDASTYEIRHAHGTVRRFVGSGQIFKLASMIQTESQMDFLYGGPGNSLSEISVNGVPRLTFEYGKTAYTNGDPLLTKIKNGIDPDEWVSFDYNGCDELSEVRRPPTELEIGGALVEPIVQYSYANVAGGQDCLSKAAGNHQLIAIKSGGSDGETETLDVIQTAGYYPPESGTLARMWRVEWQCFGKVCGDASEADLVYDYVQHLGNSSRTYTYDQRGGGVARVDRRTYSGSNLGQLYEDYGGLHRLTEYNISSSTGLRTKEVFPDGRCVTTDHVEVNGAWLEQVTRVRVPEGCTSAYVAPRPDDLVTYRTYETFRGKLRTVTGPAAFPGGVIPTTFDPEDPAIKPYTQFYYYDFDEGSSGSGGSAGNPPVSASQFCQDWDLDCTLVEQQAANPEDLNGVPEDDGNWLGNLVKSASWLPADASQGRSEHERKQLRAYNSHGRLIRSVAPNGTVTEYYYYNDPGAQGVEPEWDWRDGDMASATGLGPVARRVTLSPSGTLSLESKAAWDSMNRQIAYQDATGRTTVYTYSKMGMRLREEVRCDATVNSDCDAQNALLRRTDHAFDVRGREVNEQIFDASAAQVYESQTTYNVRGWPLTVTIDPGGLNETTHLFYDDFGRLIKTISPEGRASCSEFDELGRIVRKWSKLELEVLPYDSECEPFFDESEEVPDDPVTNFVVDAVGRPVKVTEPTGIPTYRWYDEHGRLEYVSDGEPAGALEPVLLGSDSIAPPAASYFSQTSYDEFGRAVRGRFYGARGPGETPGYMTAQWTTYDEHNRVVAESAAWADGLIPEDAFITLGPPAAPVAGLKIVESRIGYNEFGQSTALTDPLGRVTEREFDGLGRLDRVDLPAPRVCDDSSGITATACLTDEDCSSAGFDGSCIDDPEGARDYQTTSYDSLGRRTGQQSFLHDPTGTVHVRESENHFDGWGRTIRTISAPDGSRVINDFEFDPLDRLERTARRWDSGSQVTPSLYDRIVEVDYDRASRMTTRRQLRADPSTSIDDESWIVTDFGFDKDGLRTSLTDSNGNQTTWDYDALGRMTRLTYPATSEGSQAQEYDYDESGRVLTARFVAPGEEPEYLAWEHTYDFRGRLEQRIADYSAAPSLAATRFGTDLQSYEYDDLNRVVRSIDSGPDFVGDDIVVESEYDSLGQLIEENQPRYVNGVLVDHRITSTYGYPGVRTILDYPDAVDESGDPLPAYSTELALDSLGRIAAIRAPEHASPESPYDNIATFDYLGGQVWSRTYRNGAQLRMYEPGTGGYAGIDDLGRTTVLRTIHESDPSQLVADFRYGYDRVGNLTFDQRQHEPDGATGESRTRVFRYDLAGRLTDMRIGNLGVDPVLPTQPDPLAVLTEANSVDWEYWSLDDLGNWSDHTETDSIAGSPVAETEMFTINSLNQYEDVTPDGGNPLNMIHDWLGQLTIDEEKSREFRWDGFGRLTQIRNSVTESLIAQYRYDASNRRVEKEVPGEHDQTTRFYYDGWRAIEERALDLTAIGAIEWEPVRARYGFGLSMDQVLWMDRDVPSYQGDPDPILGSPDGSIESRYFVHHDLRGSAIALTEDTEASQALVIAERYSYSGYGTTEVFWDTTWASGTYGVASGLSKVGFAYLFTGQRFDNESQLYYFKHRTYDPERGRFIRRDLIGYGDGPGLYQYAASNPVLLVDPLGLATVGMGVGTPEAKGTNYGGGLAGSSSQRSGVQNCGFKSVQFRNCGEKYEYYVAKSREQGEPARDWTDEEIADAAEVGIYMERQQSGDGKETADSIKVAASALSKKERQADAKPDRETGSDSKDGDDDEGGPAADEAAALEEARQEGVDALTHLEGIIDAAQDGQRRAQRTITKFFGEDADLADLKGTVALMKKELTSAKFVPGDPAPYTDDPKNPPAAWVKPSVPGTIFYDPAMTGRKTLAALVTHEAAHLAGVRGHSTYDGATAYHQNAARGLAADSGWSETRRNPSNYACAAFPGSPEC